MLVPLQESAEAKLPTLEHLTPNPMKVSAVSKPEIMSKRLNLDGWTSEPNQSLPHQIQCRTIRFL